MFPEHDMLFSFEFELSSVSVLFVVSFCRFVHVRSGCHMSLRQSHLRCACGRTPHLTEFRTNKSNRFYVKQISDNGGSIPPYHTQVDILLPSCFLFVYAHHERYSPSPMGLSIYLGTSAFPWTFD